MPEIKLASKKQKLTQTINTEPDERNNVNIIQKENNTSKQQEINLKTKNKNNDNFIQKDDTTSIQQETDLNATKENNSILQNDNSVGTTNSVVDETKFIQTNDTSTTTVIDIGFISTGSNVLEREKNNTSEINSTIDTSMETENEALACFNVLNCLLN